MSSKTPNIFSESYDYYAEALYKYLDSKGIEKVWLAEKITPKGQKIASTQEKLSRWKREGSKPSRKTRIKINELLDVYIYQDKNGKWVVSRTEKSTSAVNNIPDSILYRSHEIRNHVKEKGIGYKDRGALIEMLQSRANTLSQELKEFSEMIGILKDLDSDPSDGKA